MKAIIFNVDKQIDKQSQIDNDKYQQLFDAGFSCGYDAAITRIAELEVKLARYEQQPIMLSVVGPIGTELKRIAKPSEPQGETP